MHSDQMTGSIVQINLENSNSDFSKYLLNRNKFQAQWIERIGPIYEQF